MQGMRFRNAQQHVCEMEAHMPRLPRRLFQSATGGEYSMTALDIAVIAIAMVRITRWLTGRKE